MGRRGPAPKSLEEIRLHGNYRPCRHADLENVPAASGEPRRPAHLTGEARAHWDAVVPALVANGTAKELDTAALTMLCEAWGLYRACLALVAKNPAKAVDKDVRCSL